MPGNSAIPDRLLVIPAILDHNLKAPNALEKIHLGGIAIGNGIVNETVQSGSFVEFAEKQVATIQH